MILKYKKGNNAWVYKKVNDVTIGKADITDIINKYINKNTGKIDITDFNYDEAADLIINRFQESLQHGISYGYVKDTIKEVLENPIHLLIEESKDDDFEGFKRTTYSVMFINTETYLMTDEGKTIERLL